MVKQNNNLFDLSSKYTLITGAMRLIGRTTLNTISKINSNLILVDINSKKGLGLKKLKKL